MSEREILDKAIQKAIENGWVAFGIARHPDYCYAFTHPFAKALWGESRPLTTTELKDEGFTGSGRITTIGWKQHLQQMVIAEDPIQYLGENM